MTVNFCRGASKSTSQRFLIFWVRAIVTVPQRPWQYLLRRVEAICCASRVVIGATQPPRRTATDISAKAPETDRGSGDGRVMPYLFKRPRDRNTNSLALAQLGQLPAHLFHFFLEVGDLVGGRGGRLLGGFGLGGADIAEGREHGHGILEQLQILPRHVLDHLVAAAQRLGDAVAHGALVLGEA